MDTYIPEGLRNQSAHRVNHDDELFGRVSTIDPDDVVNSKGEYEDDWLDAALDALMMFLAIVGAMSLALAIGLYASGFYQWLATKMPDNKVLQFLFG